MATTTTTQSLPSNMLAAQIVGFHKPHSINKIPVPDINNLNPHDLYLKVAVSGLCHSDLEYLKGTFPHISLPITGSHEGTGVILAKGSAVDYFNVGDRILAGQTFGRCGECDICKGPENYRHYCPHRETMMSVHRNGAFQEYLIVDGREAALIPDSMSFATAAPLACAGMTSWRGVKQCELKPGQWIAIVGSGGGLGHLAIQMAKKAFGLKVVGVDARDEGLALTEEAGADLVLDARIGKEKLVEQVHKHTDGKGVHAALNVSDAKSAAPTAAAITRDHGTVVQVALIDEVSLPFHDVIFRNIHLKGSFMASQAEIQEMLYAVVEHKIKLENNIFHGIPEIPRAVEMLRNGEYRGKACIVVDEGAPGTLPGDSRM
ncbi:hypothetical protein LTS08_006542 [Lithohypha guttulata]|nr:hypothetical protein LTS08_006542 [Lithohypha guttulata]